MRKELTRKLGGILEIYEKFQGVDPRDVPMKIFPAVHYSMGGLWADYERTPTAVCSPVRRAISRPTSPTCTPSASADYQYHGANRLGANSLLSCMFAGLFVAPGIYNLLRSQSKGATEQPASLFQSACRPAPAAQDELIRRPAGGENPYKLHEELGDLMTKAATVVRRNDQLREAIDKLDELHERAKRCSLSDTGNWTNQNLVFTSALTDMIPLAKTILGRLAARRVPRRPLQAGIRTSESDRQDGDERRREAEQWCDDFEANNRKWLKSTIATWNRETSQPELTYEDVDTSLIPPRPRLYGLFGAEVIEEVWNERAQRKNQQ
jgi:succinate dehydrogenase / fumarate reductase, flavoprotein subunit